MVQTLEQTIARMKREIVQDVKDGHVPVRVTSFGDLDSYRDANCYGGICEDDVLDPLITHFGGRDEHEGMPDALLQFINQAQDAVDAWIKSEGLENRCEEEFGNEWLSAYGDLLVEHKELCLFIDQHLSKAQAGIVMARKGFSDILLQSPPRG